MKRAKVSVLDVDFINTNLQDMTQTLVTHAKNNDKVFVVTANPEIVLHSKKHDDYKNILHEATYITADGIGIVIAAKILGRSLQERVTGYDLFIELLKEANENRQSLYLLGAKEDVLANVVKKMNEQFPNIDIVGAQHGYFDKNDPTIVETIKSHQPDYIFVALGFPRQEQWIQNHWTAFEKGVFIGIGGSFDVFSGAVKRAPKIWQKLHLEWLFRLLQQPSRWRRMLALPKFMIQVFIEKAKGK